MKKLPYVFLLAAFALCSTSCSTEDDCLRSDWIGSYTLQGDNECDFGDGSSITADPTLIVEAGEGDLEILIADEVGVIDPETCTVSGLFFGFSKAGDQITFSIGTGCSFIYEKN